jgi:hypothetical protein
MEPPDLCLVMEYMPKGSLYKILHDQYVLTYPLNNRYVLVTQFAHPFFYGIVLSQDR